MRAAPLPRLIAALAALAAAACGVYLLDARGDEAQLADAQRSAARGQHAEARAQARGLDGPTTAGRAAELRATAALQRGDLPGALRDLRRAVRERPNDWRQRRSLAVVLALTGDADGARRQARRALELNPQVVLPSAFEVRSGG